MDSTNRSPFDKSQLFTIFGRKPVLEALQDNSLSLFRLHLSNRNKSAAILDDIESLAHQRNIEIITHTPLELSRISKNSKQDQGIALDVKMPSMQPFDGWLNQSYKPSKPAKLLALDGVTNPQNLGMIIRSVAASDFDGLVLPQTRSAKLSPLVIKASAGTIFKASLFNCGDLAESLKKAQQYGAKVAVLDGASNQDLFQFQRNQSKFIIYVLGNETDGCSQNVNRLADYKLSIAMNNDVESLNVAVTAGIILFNGG